MTSAEALFQAEPGRIQNSDAQIRGRRIRFRPGAQRLARMLARKDYSVTGKAVSSYEIASRKVYDQPRGDLDNRYNVSLEKITLKNFRGVGRKVEFLLGGGITVLFGINGTGKTLKKSHT